MKRVKYVASGARCPFYKHHEAKCVVCEGFRKVTELILSFSTSKDRELFMVEFCNHIYERCNIYKALEREAEFAEMSRKLRRKHERNNESSV